MDGENPRPRGRMASAREQRKETRSAEPFDPCTELFWHDFLNATASEYLLPFACRPGDRFVLLLRVSRPWQEPELAAYEAELSRAVAAAGGEVVGIVRHVGRGSSRGWLRGKVRDRAARKARKRGAVLLAWSADRVLRHRMFGKPGVSQNRLPDGAEFARLMRRTGGVPVMTLHPPDMAPSKIRSLQRRLGQERTGNKGGRPKGVISQAAGYKKAWRVEMAPVVLRMRREGRSFREIEQATGVDHVTARRWIKKDE